MRRSGEREAREGGTARGEGLGAPLTSEARDDSACVVTGASSGVGKAVTQALALEGRTVWALGRDGSRLDELASTAPGHILPLAVDLEDEDAVVGAAGSILGAGSVDVLVHSAGKVVRGPVESSTTADLDALYHVTLRGPFVLTRALLPGLRSARGAIVFINSLVRAAADSDAVLYASMKQAVRTFADGLRQEVNADGIRVTTISLGRTDTPMQEWVHEYEEREYDARHLLRPEDVAGFVLAALAAGRHAELTDASIRTVARFEPRRP